MKIECCPVCGHHQKNRKTSSVLQVETVVFQIINCEKCDHYFTFFSEEVNIDKYYDDLDYTVRDNRKTIFHKIQEIEYNKVLKRLNRLSTERELLDFGCGKGVFLSFAKAKGYVVNGVETSMPRADYARKVFNIDVNTDLFTKGNIFGKRFPIITMFHVLEHIPEVKSFLRNLYSENLSPGGIAVIEVPNYGSTQSRWSKENWLQIDIPRHVSHFTEQSLESLFEQLHLQVLKKETFSLHLGVLSMVQTIMSFFGYKGFLLSELKTKRTPYLLLRVLLTLPFAFILEWICSVKGNGGVLRYYLKQKV